MVAIILSALAVVFGVVAIVIAAKNKKEVITKTEIKYGPVEHPFTYDEKRKAYTLEGSLECTGTLSCMSKKQ